jgi:hypothetical protein
MMAAALLAAQDRYQVHMTVKVGARSIYFNKLLSLRHLFNLLTTTHRHILHVFHVSYPQIVKVIEL